MVETNVSAFWNSAGDLEFRQGNQNASGPLLMRFNASNNGCDVQVASTAAAANSANVATGLNFAIPVTDSAGTTIYLYGSTSLVT